MVLLRSAAIFGGINALGLGISIFDSHEHRHLDLLGTGAFVVHALAVQSRSGTLHQALSKLAIAVWGTRLAGFLCYRACILKHDARLEDLLKSTSGAAAFWSVSFVWGFLVSLPHTLGTIATVRPKFGALAAGGALICAFGFAVEAVADMQKWNFKQTHPGKFCSVGLWSVSQHPNYFGNLCFWSGIFLLNLPLLRGVQAVKGHVASRGHLLVAAVSPIFVGALLYGQAIGVVLPEALQLASKKYGSDPEYEVYVKTTPVLFPTLSSLFGR
eukprot:gnl/TRDRNA2_/TRDRNA2_55457_c0_seq1.p1 gnl/TRDRNA2_/TRDRNA2_55457_c0~~gnl/TRDRNA2_/TRDRNA2_55457_c0_seq1.p1  ORF type:complete len:271 (+),score=27.21 gnl/TRDRNA2_/TRDRNA2_55457_c0_seq1:52-864(+)